MVEFSLVGLDGVLEKMRNLAPELRNKLGRRALGKAARLVREQAKKNAMQVDDVETGRKIAENIVQRFRSRYYKQTGDLMISIGVATEKGRIPRGNPDKGAGGNTPHWHLIELGREGVAAEPFLRPALESNVGAATDVFLTELERGIDRVINKTGV